MPPRYAATVSKFRPYTEAELKQIAGQLSGVYGRAQGQLLGLLAQGNLTDWRKAYTAQQVQQIQVIMRDLQAASVDWLQTRTPLLYKRGMWVADGYLQPGGLSKAAHPGQWTPMDLGMTRLHQEAVGVLAENAALRLGEANNYCAQRLQDMIARAQKLAELSRVSEAQAMIGQMQIREASLQVLQQSFAQGQTVQQAQRRFLADLQSRGITSFTDKAGREWDMESYADMVARTVSQEAQRHGMQNRCIERGVDLVQVTEHGTDCEVCAPWEGTILSLQGKTEGYPTVEEAIGDVDTTGLFHPRCAHALVPYIE